MEGTECHTANFFSWGGGGGGMLHCIKHPLTLRIPSVIGALVSTYSIYLFIYSVFYIMPSTRATVTLRQVVRTVKETSTYSW